MKINTEGAKRVIKNTGYLVFGSIFTKGLLMVVFIYVARILGPEQYGTYYTAIEYVGLVALFSRLGFDMTAIREGAKQLEHVSEIQNKLLPIRFYFSIVVAIIGFTVALVLDYNEFVTKLIIVLLPLVLIGGAISSGLIEHFNTSFRIIENMKIVTIIQIIRTVFFVFFSGLFILARYFNLYILAIIVVISSLFALYVQILYAKKYFEIKVNFNIDILFLKEIIKPVLLFGVVSILYMVSMKIDIQMLSNMINQKEVGYYAAGWQINNIGVVFIASLSLSLFPNSARLIKQRLYRNKLALFILTLSLVFALFSFAITFFSRDIVSLIFGAKFDSTIEILKILIWFIPIRVSLLWGSQILECGDFLVTRVGVYLIPMLINIILNLYYIPKLGAVGAAYVSIISNIIMLILVTGSALYITKYKL